jgi:hypothetical protein
MSGSVLEDATGTTTEVQLGEATGKATKVQLGKARTAVEQRLVRGWNQIARTVTRSVTQMVAAEKKTR